MEMISCKYCTKAHVYHSEDESFEEMLYDLAKRNWTYNVRFNGSTASLTFVCDECWFYVAPILNKQAVGHIFRDTARAEYIITSTIEEVIKLSQELDNDGTPIKWIGLQTRYHTSLNLFCTKCGTPLIHNEERNHPDKQFSMYCHQCGKHPTKAIKR